MNFAELRAQWALKYQPTNTEIDYERRTDQMTNPHNEPYHNKRPRRETEQIISDVCYAYADGVLLAQYGNTYRTWLNKWCEQTPFTGVWRQKRFTGEMS